MVDKINNRVSVAAISIASIIAIIGVGTAVYAMTLDTSENEALVREMNLERSELDSHPHTTSDKIAAQPSFDQASLVIVYNDGGFDETSYTVGSGQTVRVENKSGKEFYFTTGDHHNHDTSSPLSLGTIAPGESSSFVAPKPGSYNFHNHDNDDQAGMLIVQ